MRNLHVENENRGGDVDFIDQQKLNSFNFYINNNEVHIDDP